MARRDTSVRAPRLYARESHSTKKRKNEKKRKLNKILGNLLKLTWSVDKQTWEPDRNKARNYLTIERHPRSA